MTTFVEPVLIANVKWIFVPVGENVKRISCQSRYSTQQAYQTRQKDIALGCEERLAVLANDSFVYRSF